MNRQSGMELVEASVARGNGLRSGGKLFCTTSYFLLLVVAIAASVHLRRRHQEARKRKLPRLRSCF